MLRVCVMIAAGAHNAAADLTRLISKDAALVRVMISDLPIQSTIGTLMRVVALVVALYSCWELAVGSDMYDCTHDEARHSGLHCDLGDQRLNPIH